MKALAKTIDRKGGLAVYRSLLILQFIAIILIFTACTGNTQINSSVENNFALKDSNGNQYELSDDAGKKVYIKFWATWCPICLGGIDELTEFNNGKADDENISVITIVSPGSKGEMSSEDFISWFNDRGYKFKVLIDEGGTVASQFKVRGYPTSVFIDTTGKIAKTQIGHVTNADIDDILNSIQ